MKSGVSRDRMSRLRPLLAGAAAVIALAGAAALATSVSGVAHATPLLTGAAATPTLDPMLVPTSAAGTGSSLSNSPLSTSSGGVELAVTLSCVTTIAGLIIAAITLTALLRTGYGPFLRALLPRWMRRKDAAATAPAQRQPTLRYQPSRNGPETGFDIYAEAPNPRGGRRPAPRDEWSDREDRAPRQPRANQAGRGSSRGSSSRAGRSRY